MISIAKKIKTSLEMSHSIAEMAAIASLIFLAGLEALATNSAISREKKVITSMFANKDEASMITASRITLECRAKLDQLTNQEIALIMQKVDISEEEMQDPLVDLLAIKGKDLISEDCRSIDGERLDKAVHEALRDYDIRFGEGNEKRDKLSEVQFFTATGMLAAHNCRKLKGFYPSATYGTDILGKAIINKGLPLSVLTDVNVVRASANLAAVLNQSCDGFTDESKAEDILIRHFMLQ